MYKKLSISDQQTVGVDLWYYNGINQNPAIIFATGRHGNKNNEIGKPYIIYSLNSKPTFLYDKKDNIITGNYSSISIDKNLILFGGNNLLNKSIEDSKLYLISPTSKKCKLVYNFSTINNFAARNCIIKDKTVIIGGTHGTVLIYNFDSKNKLLNSKKINIAPPNTIIVGLYYYKNILSVGVRINSSKHTMIDGICKPIDNRKFAKSAIINLSNNNIKYFTTSMQCTDIYYNEKYIICVGSGQIEYFSQCFYIPITNNKFGKKVNLGICDGRELLVINNDLFILCVTCPHVYISNFTKSNRKFNFIKNINAPCRGCLLYNNNCIIISSIDGVTVILDLTKINKNIFNQQI
jgi:hypothetical protein